MTYSLRLAFMGTPDFAVGALQALLDSAHDVVCVYTQPPRPKGRGKQVQPSPVQLLAEKHGIEVRHPLNFKAEEDRKAFADLNLDVAVVAAYGLILPGAILESPRFGCINIHASLLPRWRGAAPIQRSIWEGDSQTGITLMQMDKGLDTGAMIAKKTIPITPTTTFPQLHDALSHMGASMIASCLDKLAQQGNLPKEEQDNSQSSYASMLTKEDGHINWQKSAIEIDRQIRALNPWPSTWTLNAQGHRFKILQATIAEKTNDIAGTIIDKNHIACGDNVLLIHSIHPENKKPMSLSDAVQGGYLAIGDRLL